MRAMVLDEPGRPLTERELPDPVPAEGQVLIDISACGVCRTDLHIVDGELTEPKLPLVLGHQIVGRVIGAGEGANRFAEGDRVGVPWLGWTDETCRYCRSGRENLCEHARFTGYDIDGGYAERTVADERFCFPIAGDTSDDHVAPLLCAGLIGYRSLRLAGEGERLGLYGFGSSAHIICQVAVAQGWRVYALTREGDTETQELARSLGAEWAGEVGDPAASDLDAAIVFAPVGELMIEALRAMAPGGTVVSAGIHMSDIPAFPYELLWHERTLRSVANLTRRDGEEFLPLAASVPVETRIQVYPLADANRALDDIRHGRVEGSAVLSIGG
ncbi:MAG: zinc-dependent alcohol dehydrogenase family protein, partial [Solirubrobacterales bacterium]